MYSPRTVFGRSSGASVARYSVICARTLSAIARVTFLSTSSDCVLSRPSIRNDSVFCRLPPDWPRDPVEDRLRLASDPGVVNAERGGTAAKSLVSRTPASAAQALGRSGPDRAPCVPYRHGGALSCAPVRPMAALRLARL